MGLMGLSKFYQDRNQNFWQLTCILSAAQSLPGILLGGVLAKKYGAPAAITSICIGNLILWLIGWGVISIAAKGRKNAIENVRSYLGRGGGILMSLILLIAFLSWYMIEIKEATSALSPLFQSNDGSKLGLLGCALGIMVAFLAIGGIRLIKWTCLVSFPFLICFMIFVNVLHDQIVLDGPWSFSFPAVITVAALTLPGMVNLPTFFRHSRSREDSFLALTMITVFDVLFQLSTIFTGMTEPAEFLTRISGAAYIGFAVAFVVISLICLNLVNIYYSAAAFQTMVPKLEGPKGYFLVGLLGTASYVFLQSSSSMLFIENMVDNFIANLGIILLVSFLVTIVVKHRPRSFQNSVSFCCWSIGCIVAMTMQIYNPQFPNVALLTGFGGSALAFLCILFYEETVWSLKKVS